MGREIISKFQHDSVKTISIDKFRVAMPMNNPNIVFGDLVLKCQLKKPFDKLRSIMKKENIDGLFKKSCFTHFLELSGPCPLRFPMIMVYGLLKGRIMYAGDDGGPKEGRNNMDEVWINYYGMPVCFGLKEFAIVTGLRYDRPKEVAIKKTPHKGSNKRKVKNDGLLGIIGPSYKVKNLIADLKNKDIPKHYGEKLCLVWFVHSVLLARDVKKVIERDLLVLADDFGKFNDYTWGYDSYYLTVKYLLKKQKPKTTTLYGFPWAFMAWAYEVIPPLRKHFTDYPDKVSYLRILRWLDAVERSKKKINEADLFNPPDDAVAHPWIVPTIDELGMTSFLTLDPGVSSEGVAGGVVCDSGSHPTAASAASRDYEHVGAQQKIKMFENTPCTGPPSHPYTGLSHLYSGPSHPSSPLYSHCKCKVYKDREDKLLDKLEAIAEDVEELKSRRGVIPSNEVREPCTPTVEVRRNRRKIRQILSILKSAKIATPPDPIVVEVQGPPKKVDIFAALGKEKKKELEELIKMKYVDEILCLMRGRQLAYPDAYDVADRIMDLNFYNNFKDRYDEEANKYVRGKRPYPHGKSWTKAKRILVVMNMDVTYFLTVEILLYEGKIKVYDCNLPVFSEKTFSTHMQPLLKLLPKLLTLSKLMDHLQAEVLAKESWIFKGRNKNIQLPKIQSVQRAVRTRLHTSSVY
ncbi:hypothetical protein P3L10_031091 [Capsicum annuum]